MTPLVSILLGFILGCRVPEPIAYITDSGSVSCQQPLSDECEPCPDLDASLDEAVSEAEYWFKVTLYQCVEGGQMLHRGTLGGFYGQKDYFDDAGRLVARTYFSDGAFSCGNLERSYGMVPACETQCYLVSYCNGVEDDSCIGHPPC